LLTLTENLTGDSYQWATDGSLFNGNGYALEITQGQAISVSNRFAITAGIDSATSAPTLSSAPANSSISSNPTETPGPNEPAASTGTAPAQATGRKKKLTKADIIGVVIGVIAACCALFVLCIFTLVLNILKKKGPPPGAGAGHHENDTPLTTITEADEDNYFPKRGEFVSTKLPSASPNANQQRSGSGASSTPPNYDIGTPDTLVPPPRRELGLYDGMSMEFNNSTATVTNTLNGPPSPLNIERAAGRPVQSWMVGDDGFTVGMAHPGNPYPHGVEDGYQRGQTPGLTPQKTGDSIRTLTASSRYSPTSPAERSNLRFETNHHV
jgi:hypothetical protein